MRFNVRRHCIEIVPECEADEVYIEEVLGLRKRGDCAVAIRRAPLGIETAMSHVEIVRPKPPGAGLVAPPSPPFPEPANRTEPKP